MLANHENAIDGQATPTAAQGLPDGGVHGHAMLRRQRHPNVEPSSCLGGRRHPTNRHAGLLLDVHRDELHAQRVEAVVQRDATSGKELAQEDVAVRALPVHRHDGGDCLH